MILNDSHGFSGFSYQSSNHENHGKKTAYFEIPNTFLSNHIRPYGAFIPLLGGGGDFGR